MHRLLFLLLLPLLTACNSQARTGGEDAGAGSSAPTVPPVPSAWTIVSYSEDGTNFTSAADPGSVLIQDGKIGGNTGCNSFGGSWTGTPDRMQVSEVMSTYMYCEEVAEQERQLLSLLKGEVTAELEEDGHLLLRRGDLLLRLAPTGYPGATPSGNNVSEQSSQNVNLSGLFIYLADAAVFKRCSDGQRFGVLLEGDAYLATERAYLNAGPGGEWRRVELVGQIEENAEAEGLPYNLRITELVGFSAGGECP